MQKFTTAAEAQAAIDELRTELTRREADIQALGLRRQQADAEVTQLTDQARAGTLHDPAKLTDAIRRQAALSAKAVPDLSGIKGRISELEEDMHRLRREDAQRAYSEAVMAYARACAPLPDLAEQVRKLAQGAQVAITEHNSPHLVGRHVVIGGAVIDI